jgi:ribosomal protein S27E
MFPSPRTATRCLVCGFTEIRTDEVDAAQRGLVLLAECPRCQHRWTRPLGGASAASRRPARIRLVEERPHAA